MKPVVIMRFFTLHKPSTYRSAKMMFNTRSGKNFKILKWWNAPRGCKISKSVRKYHKWLIPNSDRQDLMIARSVMSW